MSSKRGKCWICDSARHLNCAPAAAHVSAVASRCAGYEWPTAEPARQRAIARFWLAKDADADWSQDEPPPGGDLQPTKRIRLPNSDRWLAIARSSSRAA